MTIEALFRDPESWRLLVRATGRVLRSALAGDLPPDFYSVMSKAALSFLYAEDSLARIDRFESYDSRESEGQNGERHAEHQLLRGMFEALPIAVILIDPSTEELAANVCAAQVFGHVDSGQLSVHFAKRDLIQVLDIATGCPLPDDQNPLVRTLRKEEFLNAGVRFTNRIDKEVRILCSSGPVDQNRNESVQVCIAFDITEVDRLREKTEEAEAGLRRALRSQEAKTAQWEALFHGISDAIFVVEVQEGGGELVNVNRAALDLLDVSSVEEVRMDRKRAKLRQGGFTLTDGRAVSEEDKPLNMVRSGKPFRNYTCDIVTPSGKEIRGWVSGEPVRQVEGAPRLYIETMRDITEIESLRESRERQMQVVTHEVRNPLQVAKGLLALADMELASRPGDPVGRYVKSVAEQIDKISAILCDVEEASKSTNRALFADRHPVSVVKAFLEALRLRQGDSCDHTIDVDLASLDGVLVLAEESRLKEVFDSLLSNSLRHSPAGCHVWVKGSLSKHAVLVRVENDGPEIPEDDIERVFEGFYRRKDLSDWHTNGMGLSLYTSRNVARHYGGDLWAENRSPAGVSMCLRLPRIK